MGPEVVKRILEITSCIFLLSRFTSCASSDIQYKDSCGKFSLWNMTESDTYSVKWSGEEMTSSACVLRFAGYGASDSNPYTICFDTLSLNLENCDIQLIFLDLSGGNKENFTCGEDGPGLWCARSGYHAHMELHGADGRFRNGSSFEIMVTASREDSFLYVKIGLVVSMVTVLAAGVLTLVCCLQKKKQRYTSAVSSQGYSKLKD